MKENMKKLIKYIITKYLCIKTNSKIDSKFDLNFHTYLEGRNVIHKNVGLSSSRIGYGTYIGNNSRLLNTKIGRYCSISENVKLVAGRHPTNTFVSTHPAFFSTAKQSGFTYVKETIFEEQYYADVNSKWNAIIGNDVWIGSNVIILDGSFIGDGVIIASGAVVSGKLEPYYIYGGIPAKKIGSRFSDGEREFLINFKWWNKEEYWLIENAHVFSDIKVFMDRFPNV